MTALPDEFLRKVARRDLGVELPAKGLYAAGVVFLPKNPAYHDEFKAHVRTFKSVFSHVSLVFGPGGYGMYMMGSDEPMVPDEATTREVLARPGILEDISSAYDSPAKSIDGWVAKIDQLRWISDAEIDNFVASGPLVTDDHPLPEYFLLRRLLNPDAPLAYPGSLTPLGRP